MIKFLQFGDLHLDAPVNKKYFNKQEENNPIKALYEIARIAKDEEVNFIFITGDLFDGKDVSNLTLTTVKYVFQGLKGIEIFISPGNHDNLSFKLYDELILDNVHVFNKFEYFERNINSEKIRIYGAGFSNSYAEKSLVPEKIILSNEFTNILVIHGELSKNSFYNPLADRISNFDYVAIGHIHKASVLSNSGRSIVYSGCPISRGFDELNEKGIVLGTIEKNVIQSNFVNLKFPTFIEYNIDITGRSDFEIIEEINNVLSRKNNYPISSDKYKFKIRGVREENTNLVNLVKNNISCDSYVEIIDNSKFDIKNNENILNNPLIKNFINKANQLDENIREKVIKTGIEVLLETRNL